MACSTTNLTKMVVNLIVVLLISRYGGAATVNGPTPGKLIAPYNTIVQYQCSGDFSEENIFDIAWKWSVNGTLYSERRTLSNSNINITDTTEVMIDVTTIRYFIGNETPLLIFSCQADIELLNGSDITVKGSTGEMISFGNIIVWMIVIITLL